MKLQDRGKVYNTESGYLLKFFVKAEKLGEGYVRYTTYRLYSKKADGDYFLHIEKIATNKGTGVIDRRDYIYPVNDEFAANFDSSFDELPLLA